MASQFDELIKEFNKIKSPNLSEKNTTFFDVAKFPHYENVASNVLSFFLDSNNDHLHGFGNIWLTGLIRVYNQNSKDKIPNEEYYTLGVEREYSNGSEKRIDILIDCDSFIIVIENKIYADLSNDLDTYTQMANNYKKTSLGVKGIVLSLSPINNDIIPASKYVNITYEELFASVESIAGEFDKNNKWQILAEEFITNIRQLKGVINMEFDKEWLKFMNGNGNSVNRLIKLYQNDIENRLNLLKELDKAFINYPNIIRHGVYNSSYDTYISQFIDVFKDHESVICIETYLMKQFSENDWERYNKLYVAIWTRKNRNYDFTNILEKLNLKDAKREQTKGWGVHYILKEIELGEAFDLKDLIDSIKSYLDKLLNK